MRMMLINLGDIFGPDWYFPEKMGRRLELLGTEGSEMYCHRSGRFLSMGCCDRCWCTRWPVFCAHGWAFCFEEVMSLIFLIESVVMCILFTLMIKLATWKLQTAFTNDYPPLVTDKLRAMKLITQKPRHGKRITSEKPLSWSYSHFCLRYCCAM